MRLNPTKRKSLDEFIEQAKNTHGDRYDYSKVEYINNHTKVCIICPEHGEFWQRPKNHINGENCPSCARICGSKKRRKYKRRNPRRSNLITIKEFSTMVKEKFGDLVEVVEYHGFTKKAKLICKNTTNGIGHGLFTVVPCSFLAEARKTICPQCLKEYRRNINKSTTVEFIEKAKKIHGDRYDYSKVNYVNNNTPICIICHDIGIDGLEHGEFWQTPQNHLSNRGCPLCKKEKNAYEKNIYKILLGIFNKNDIIWQYRNKEILDTLTIDFYIPKYNIAIEHQGSQHFRSYDYFGGDKKYEELILNDKKKYELLKQHNIKLLYFSYEKYWVPDKYLDVVYTDVEEFVKVIKEIKYNNKFNIK